MSDYQARVEAKIRRRNGTRRLVPAALLLAAGGSLLARVATSAGKVAPLAWFAVAALLASGLVLLVSALSMRR